VRKLLVFRSLTHDPQGVLTAVDQLAFMGVELLLDGGLRVPPIRFPSELCIASFADSEHRNVSDPLYDPKIALWHDCSLAHPGGRT
jgi:hypothetical protein